MITELINNFFPVILFTDIFISLFNWAIRFLNSNHFPVNIATDLLYSDKTLKPKFEIQIYVLLIFLSTLSMMIFHKINKKKHIKNDSKLSLLSTIIKGLITLLLLVFFINQIGDYPLLQNIPENSKFIYVYLSIILMLISIFSFTYFFWKKHPFFLKLFFLSIILLIARLTFISKLPIYFHDFSFFLGPIIQIAKGKTLFTQIFSRYSFLGVLILGYLDKFSLFNPVYFPLLIWLLYVIQYFVCFYLILKISDSVVLALVTLFSILTVNFYSLMHFPTLVPEIGPVRWLPLILSIYFLYQFQSFQSKKFIFILALLSFFTIDSGIFLILAYSVSLGILFLNNQLTIKKTITLFSWLLLSLIMIFVAINIINLLLGYRLLNLLPVFQGLKSLASSYLLMKPIGDQSHFWLIVLVYLASLNQFFKKHKSTLVDTMLLFSTNLTAITAIYFVGESHPHNLLNISMFMIINVGFLMATIIKNSQSGNLRLGLLLIYLLLFIVYPALSRSVSIEDNITNQLVRMKLAPPFEPEVVSILHSYDREVNLINSNLGQKEILLLSPDDAYLYYLLKDKTSLIDTIPQQVLISKNEEKKAFKRVFTVCPKKIVVDCRILGKCEEFITLNSAHYPVEQSFTLEKNFSISILKTIENKCRLNYQPTICTQKLCVAVAK